AAARAAPDGYTMVMATGGDVAINPAMFKEMPYDVEGDLAPIAMVSDAPLVLAAHAGTPYNTVADVIAAANAQPGRLSVATPGNGSINQIVLEWMALNTGTQFQHIPYKGGAPAAAALAAGDIPLGVLASSSVAPHVKSGRVRVLAVTMAKRSTLNPEWPTLQQEGVKEIDASNWTALFAPKATPQPIIDKLSGGALLASFAAYMFEKKVAKPPRAFGHGDIRGVAAPESANNAGAQTSFIPMLTLGIPSNPTMALMIGALMIQGIAPGPQVMTERPELFWGLIASMWVGNLMLLVLNLPLVGLWIRLLAVPYRLLFPAIFVFCCIGAYAVDNKIFDVYELA